MELPELPRIVSKIVEELVSEGALSVWLIGSRANGCAREDSDWDLLVFSPLEPQSRDERAHGVDVIEFGPSGNWRLEGEQRLHERNDWNWQLVSESEAVYSGIEHGISDRIFDPFEEGRASFIERKAIRIWPP